MGQEITWMISGHKKQLPADNQCGKQDLIYTERR